MYDEQSVYNTILWDKYLIIKSIASGMFKNRYFARNSHFNRKFIDGLNRLSHQSEKMERLEKELQELKTRATDTKSETKTSDDSETTIAAKTPRESREQFFQPKQEPSCLYVKFRAFIKEVQEDKCQFCQQQAQPQQNKEDLVSVQVWKRTQLILAKKLINWELGRLTSDIKTLCSKRISSRIKLYFIYTILKDRIQKLEEQSALLIPTCLKLLKQVFKILLIEQIKPRYQIETNNNEQQIEQNQRKCKIYYEQEQNSQVFELD